MHPFAHRLLQATACAALALPVGVRAQGPVLTGQAAFGDWRSDAPGLRRHITVADLPAPYATGSSGNPPAVVERPEGAVPRVPPGFQVTLLAEGLRNPRLLRVAPNGDLFVAETGPGRVLVFPGGNAGSPSIFAGGLDHPFGIAFYPPGPTARYVYVASQNAVHRYAYQAGDTAARGPAETIIPRLAATAFGHTTRDIGFSLDGARMYVSVGSGSNVAEEMPKQSAAQVAEWQAAHALGAAWGAEENRADVLSFTPDGRQSEVFAAGIRNCVGLAVQPGTGAVWCSTNERDGLGDNLVPDYVTRVTKGAFYGWPWYYLGEHEDPRHANERPDLHEKMTVPDVLLQPHSASLEMAFYDGTAFPPTFRGAFAAEHGSWNRAKRTGYKVIRIVLDAKGNPTGEYEDFMTGFVAGDGDVWGRPVGVAVGRDGSLFVSEDGNGTIWRVTYTGGHDG